MSLRAGPVPVNPAQGDAADAHTLRVSAVAGARDSEVDELIVAMFAADVLKQNILHERTVVVWMEKTVPWP